MKEIIIKMNKSPFCNTYNDDAIIISNLMDYKLKINNVCGFPKMSLDKVLLN